MSGLVILAASFFEISCGKTNRQTDTQTNASKNSTPAITVDVGNDENATKTDVSSSCLVLQLAVIDMSSTSAANN